MDVCLWWVDGVDSCKGKETKNDGIPHQFEIKMRAASEETKA